MSNKQTEAFNENLKELEEEKVVKDYQKVVKNPKKEIDESFEYDNYRNNEISKLI